MSVAYQRERSRHGIYREADGVKPSPMSTATASQSGSFGMVRWMMVRSSLRSVASVHGDGILAVVCQAASVLVLSYAETKSVERCKPGSQARMFERRTEDAAQCMSTTLGRSGLRCAD